MKRAFPLFVFAECMKKGRKYTIIRGRVKTIWRVVPMLKMLVVEDEWIEREGLRDLVDWSSLGIEVIGFAESAEKALENYYHVPFDILFTDIMLVRMNGLELVEKMLESKPELIIIITSGYSDFEFAKQAVKLRAWSYLTKPINIDELEKVVREIVITCERDAAENTQRQRLKKLVHRNMPLIKDGFFKRLVGGALTSAEAREEMEHFELQELPDHMYTIMVFEIDDFTTLIKNKDWNEIQMLVMGVLEEVEAANLKDLIYTFYLGNGRFCCVISLASVSENVFSAMTFGYAEAVKNRLGEHSGLDTTIGLGNSVSDIIKLNISFTQAEEALKYSFYTGFNEIIRYRDIMAEKTHEIPIDLNALEQDILNHVKLCNIEGMIRSVDAVFDTISKNRMGNSFAKSLCIRLISKVSLFLYEMNESLAEVFGDEDMIWSKLIRFNTIVDIRQWIKNILAGVIEHQGKKKNNQNKKIVESIIDYINNNLSSSSITINEIANQIFFSPNYISIIFKKETGNVLSDYIIHMKMEKAKKMLQDPQYKVYQAANAVGYTSVSYFCTLFKKTYGVSPNEYKGMV